MGTVNLSLPADGSTADVSDYNTPLTTLQNEFNGNIDNANIKSTAAISGSKLAAASVTNTQINFGGSGTGIWWEEIGRTTLTSASDTITVSSIPARKYLTVIIASLATGGTTNGALSFNGDTGNNYSVRFSLNGGADSTSTSTNGILTYPSTAQSNKESIATITNILNQEKILIGTAVASNSAGAANAPEKAVFSGKWANTSAQISSVTLTNTGTGDFAIGSEIVVLGHD